MLASSGDIFTLSLLTAHSNSPTPVALVARLSLACAADSRSVNTLTDTPTAASTATSRKRREQARTEPSIPGACNHRQSECHVVRLRPENRPQGERHKRGCADRQQSNAIPPPGVRLGHG